MGKTFDSIDIILIILISLCLLTIVIMIMWIILSKLENIEIAKKGTSRLSSDTKLDKIIENTKQILNEEEASVFLGLMLGYKNDIDENTQNDFRNAISLIFSMPSITSSLISHDRPSKTSFIFPEGVKYRLCVSNARIL